MLYGRERSLYFMGCLEKRSREGAATDRQYLTQCCSGVPARTGNPRVESSLLWQAKSGKKF